MKDWTNATLVDAANAIANGEVTANDLTEQCLAKINDHAALNSFISLDADESRAAAQAADEHQRQGKPLGALHGVPLAHKDMFYREGRISTCGSRIRRDFVPDHTATVIERLNAAGALHLGGLNMAEFAFSPTGHNAHYGAARNPWNNDYISGGSSSGSGAAVGARLLFGALGSDTGGSVRLPAAACGVTGIKPTQGRVSRHGVMGLSFSLDNVGPLARTARDCARLLNVIAGCDPQDPTTATRPVPDYEAATINPDIRDWRIGRPRNYYYDRADDDVVAAMNDSLEILASLGAEIVDVEVPMHDVLAGVSTAVSGPESATLHGPWLRDRPDDYGPQVKARIEPGLVIPAIHYLEALQLRPKLVTEYVNAVFSQCDLLHTPTINRRLPTIAESDVSDSPDFEKLLASVSHCTRPFNYLTLPAVAVPAGFIDGLPVSFQLAGRPFAEAALLACAAAYQTATTWLDSAP